MPRVDDEIAYDEAIEEARPAPRQAGPRPRRPHERWRRIAEQSQPCVLSRDGYSYTPHSHDREIDRRMRQLANLRKSAN